MFQTSHFLMKWHLPALKIIYIFSILRCQISKFIVWNLLYHCKRNCVFFLKKYKNFLLADLFIALKYWLSIQFFYQVLKSNKFCFSMLCNTYFFCGICRDLTKKHHFLGGLDNQKKKKKEKVWKYGAFALNG